MNDESIFINVSKTQKLLHKIDQKVKTEKIMKEINKVYFQKSISTEDLDEIARALIKNDYRKEGAQILVDEIKDSKVSIYHRLNIAFDLFDIGCKEESFSGWMILLSDDSLDEDSQLLVSNYFEDFAGENHWGDKIICRILDTNIDLQARKVIIGKLAKDGSAIFIDLSFKLLESEKLEPVLRIHAVRGLISVFWKDKFHNFYEEYDDKIQIELLKIIEVGIFPIDERKWAVDELLKCRKGFDELHRLMKNIDVDEKIRDYSKAVIDAYFEKRGWKKQQIDDNY